MISRTKKKITIKQACFGVPGNPSENQDYIKPFHVTFAVSAKDLGEKTKLEKIKVVNDYEVVGYGIDALNPEQVISINKGKDRNDHPLRAIIGAGNGVGSCLMIWDTERKHYKPSPAGFCYSDFPITNSQEFELVNFIKDDFSKKYKIENDSPLSWGVMLGLMGGIKKIYDFLGTKQNYSQEAKKFNTPQEVFDAASSNQQAQDAVNLYMKFYSRLIRNVAYTSLPHGGLYITNAVVENNPKLFTTGSFFENVANCGLREIVEEVPMYVVTDSKVKLYGTAQYLLLNQ